MENEERAVAEDLRRQLQQRSSDEPKWSREEALQWLNEHRELFAGIMSVTSGGLGDGHEVVNDVLRYLEGVTLVNPYDDLLTHSIMQTLCKEVEEACKNLGIALRSGVAYGSTKSLEVEAARYPVHFTEASVISLSKGFILFCSDVSKVFALSLPHDGEGETVKVVVESSPVYAKIGSDASLKYHWTEVIGAYAYGSGPANVKHRVVPHPASITRHQVMWAMERFSVAHEYAHHVAGHGRRQFATKGVDPEGLLEEYEADAFALALSRYLGAKEERQNMWEISGAGAVLLLKCLECVRRARQVLLTGDDVVRGSGSHPEVSDRIEAFNYLDPSLPEHERISFRKLRDNVATLIDSVWPKLKRYYVMMYENGLRPESACDDSWLPRL
jgi:hypothetical protein